MNGRQVLRSSEGAFRGALTTLREEENRPSKARRRAQTQAAGVGQRWDLNSASGGGGRPPSRSEPALSPAAQASAWECAGVSALGVSDPHWCGLYFTHSRVLRGRRAGSGTRLARTPPAPAGSLPPLSPWRRVHAAGRPAPLPAPSWAGRPRLLRKHISFTS